MKVLWSWLLELCDLDRQPTPDEGAAALTRGGIEIEGIEALGGGFSGVVVAEVVGKHAHPSADKLTLVDVITERGGAATQVVCGAPNVPEPGRKVLWAQIGATLPGGITLAAKPVKGVVSPGMLCAEDELGLGDSHAGIIVLDAGDATPLGAPAQRALGLADHVLELSAPANRGDVLGYLGVARELVAVLGGRVVPPDASLDGLGGDGPGVAIDIADAALCPRYTARVIDGVRVAPSPTRIAQRLRAVGVRAISNLVDITNYVLFELGQPLHAFDAHRLALLRADGSTAGRIAVARARDAEPFVTLDGIQRTLVPDDIVIRDGDRAVALAGVMGGRETEVTDATTRILLESASFSALAIRRTAKRLALPSEASLRFSRGVDPELASFASARAARLICQLAGGRVVGPLSDAYPGKRTAAPITVRLARVSRVTGVALDAAACTRALERLEFRVAPAGQGALTVTPPSARTDITREVDAIEEILRISGYDQVPSTLPALRQAPLLHAPNKGDLVRHALAAAGASEAITYGFQSAERCGALGLPGTDRRTQPIAIKNPMSAEQAVMRTSLLPNLGAAVARNQSFGRPDANLFEVGSVFLRRGEGMTEQSVHELPDEPVWLAGVLAGKRPGRIGDGTPYDAFDAKALALAAIRAIAGDVDVQAIATAVAYLHPGVAGALLVDRARLAAELDVPAIGPNGIVGWFGELHPEVRARLGIDGPAFAYEIYVDVLSLAPPAAMRAIPKYPGSNRDVSLLLGEAIPAARVAQVIAAASQPLVAGVRLLEDYRDAKLGEGKKSMLWSIVYRAPDRTLTVAEVDQAHEAIVRKLVEDLPAQPR